MLAAPHPSQPKRDSFTARWSDSDRRGRDVKGQRLHLHKVIYSSDQSLVQIKGTVFNNLASVYIVQSLETSCSSTHDRKCIIKVQEKHSSYDLGIVILMH